MRIIRVGKFVYSTKTNKIFMKITKRMIYARTYTTICVTPTKPIVMDMISRTNPSLVENKSPYKKWITDFCARSEEGYSLIFEMSVFFCLF